MGYRDYEYVEELDANDEGWEDYAYARPYHWEALPSVEVLRGVLRADLADASGEVMNDALDQMLDSMSAAEGFNFAKALQQIGGGVTQALSDPTVNSIVRTALPLATTAIGTVYGGPAGGAVGSGLGNILLNALPPAAGARPPSAQTPSSTPPAAPAVPTAPIPAAPVLSPPAAVAGGSAAAAQGLVLTQQPDVLKALLSLAVGRAGKASVNGIPVPQIMNLLSDVFGRAAAHADELMYGAGDAYAGGEAAEQVRAPDSHALYVTLMDANAMELAESLDGSYP